MTYIRSDGTVVQGTRPRVTDPLKKACAAFWDLPAHWRAAAIVIFAMLGRQWLHPNPFANGRIPAASVEPDQHWKRIKEDDLFVRTMTEPLGKGTYWQGRKERMHESVQQMAESNDPKHFRILMGGVDFGGPDGHVAEVRDWGDLKYVQGTRCSTARSAITAYFCGAEVAENHDVGLAVEKRRPYSVGVASFTKFLSCRHQEGERNGSHRRSVYRLGIGCQDILAGYSHAFSIVAQPDGSFLWLQSFIGQYSLQQWMDKTKFDGSPQAELTWGQLQAKLKQMIRLMDITGWTNQANQDYLELFGVNKGMNAHTWKPDQRLEFFVWDEACEYPLPSTQTDDPLDQEASSQPSHFDLSDQCVMNNIREQLRSAGLKL